MAQTISYSLYDKMDKQFITVKHPSIKVAIVWKNGYINHHNIAILKVVGITVVGEICSYTQRPIRATTVDLELADKQYLPMNAYWKPNI